jgi:hypothetical protein
MCRDRGRGGAAGPRVLVRQLDGAAAGRSRGGEAAAADVSRCEINLSQDFVLEIHRFIITSGLLYIILRLLWLLFFRGIYLVPLTINRSHESNRKQIN